MVASTCNYLRVSVTDRCNLNCIYCTPERLSEHVVKTKMLTTDELVTIVSRLVKGGISHVRLTGGEPLLRSDIVELTEKLANIPGLNDLSMTTNGILFCEKVNALRAAGLKRVNISIDTLKSDRFPKLTGAGSFSRVCASLQMALDAGFERVKINTVLLEGINDDEMADFANLTKEHPLDIRFIEYMGTANNCTFTPRETILKKLSDKFTVEETAYSGPGSGPAEYYKIKGAKGFIGFISPNTKNFCDHCSRLRLSCDGKLYPCLFSSESVDARELIANDDIDDVNLIPKLIDKSGYHRHGMNMTYFGG